MLFVVAIDLPFILTKFQSAFLGLIENAKSPVLSDTLSSVSM